MKQSITRSLFVSILMVFALATAWAQKSVLDESFTGSSLPAGWTAGENWVFTEGNAKFFAPFASTWKGPGGSFPCLALTARAG